MRPLLLVVILSSVSCFGDDAPEPRAISAKVAKPGDTVTITGVGLGVSKVDEVYLTDHKFDMKVKVLEQKDSSITVRVPPFAKPGRVQLLMLTKGEDPKLLEQPLYLVIEEATTEIGEVKKPDAKHTPDPKQ
jgi:hypothetical protein